MPNYKNLSKRSGVSSYSSSRGKLVVSFNDGSNYLYTNKVTGSYRLGKMRNLASKGKGLNKYINKSVGSRYAAKS